MQLVLDPSVSSGRLKHPNRPRPSPKLMPNSSSTFSHFLMGILARYSGQVFFNSRSAHSNTTAPQYVTTTTLRRDPIEQASGSYKCQKSYAQSPSLPPELQPSPALAAIVVAPLSLVNAPEPPADELRVFSSGARGRHHCGEVRQKTPWCNVMRHIHARTPAHYHSASLPPGIKNATATNTRQKKPSGQARAG